MLRSLTIPVTGTLPLNIACVVAKLSAVVTITANPCLIAFIEVRKLNRNVV